VNKCEIITDQNTFASELEKTKHRSAVKTPG